MYKKQIPYQLLSTVEPIFFENLDIIGNKLENNCYYSFYDKDENSNFYFKIIIDPIKANVSLSNDKSDILCEYFPGSLTNTEKSKSYYKKDKVFNAFKLWTSYVRKYNEAKSIYDDPFIERYQKFYYEKFNLIDEDKFVAPFNPDRQEGIEKYLDYVELEFQPYREVEDKDFIVKDIIIDVQDLKNKLNKLTKNEVFTKLTTIWAKTFKWSKNHAKVIIKKAQDELIKELIRYVIKSAIDGKI